MVLTTRSNTHAYPVVCISKDYTFLNDWFHILG